MGVVRVGPDRGQARLDLVEPSRCSYLGILFGSKRVQFVSAWSFVFSPQSRYWHNGSNPGVLGHPRGMLFYLEVQLHFFNGYSILHVARLQNNCIISVDACFDSLQNRFVFCSITLE